MHKERLLSLIAEFGIPRCSQVMGITEKHIAEAVKDRKNVHLVRIVRAEKALRGIHVHF